MTRRMFLHIGQGKTGTSTIQEFLAEHRAELAERGYQCPRMRARRNVELSLYARGEQMESSPSWSAERWGSPAELCTIVEERLPRRIRRSGCENVVLSDEALWRLPPARLARLMAVLEPLVDEMVLVVYLRRQDEHVVSRYKQSLREGRTWLLSEYLDRQGALATWRYDETLDALAEHFPAARIVVRPYHRSRFRDRGLVQDFLEAIGVTGMEVDDTADGRRVNMSLDACTSEYLRRHNVRVGGTDPELDGRLTRISDGPDLVMTEEEHLRLWERFRDSNARLVERYAPDAADVFLSPPEPRPGLTQEEITDEHLASVEARLAADGRP